MLEKMKERRKEGPAVPRKATAERTAIKKEVTKDSSDRCAFWPAAVVEVEVVIA
jgi:hypothetical protein